MGDSRMTSATSLLRRVTAGRIHFRLLPLTLLAAFVMLSVKVGTVWNGVSAWSDMSVSAVHAEAQTAIRTAAAATNADAPPKPPGATADGKPTAPAASASAETQPARDPTRFSQSEIDLLQALSARRDALDKRERELGAREEVVKAAEKRLAEKVADLDSVKSELLRLIGHRNEKQDANLKSLVKIYEVMKPGEAAKILEQLDTEIVVGVFERMKESKVAPILANMTPERAKVITALLVDKKDATLTTQ